MGVKVATTSTFHQWVAHPIVHHSSSLSQTLASSAVSSPSRRRSIGNDGRSLSCRSVMQSQSQRLNPPSSLFGTNLRHSKSCELWEPSRPTKTQLIRRAFSGSVDPFSEEEFSKKMQELTLKFQVSNEEDIETETNSDHLGSHSFGIKDGVDRSSSVEPPWPEMLQMSSIERKANSVDLPLSLRIIKRKLQMEEGVIKQVGESACCSVKRAFSSMVFMIRELQSFTLHMRELLLFEDLQGILLRVRKEMHASFVWLFQQVFSATPTLMVSVMILLANFTVYSIGSNSALAAAVPQPPTATVSFTFDTTDISESQEKFDSSIIKTFSVSSPNGKTSFVGGGGSGGNNIPPVQSGTDGDGSDQFRIPSQFSSSSLGAKTADSEVSVSGQEEIRLWNLILEESEKMEALDHETMKQMVSPVEARLEAEESMDYFKTELLYQTGLSQQPDNVLLLANYAQFLYLIINDYDSNFNKSGPVTRGCLKIDLTKAFDNLHWDFILMSLKAFDLPDIFITWIRECITTTSFSINFNGDLTGFFRGEKGIRQGDPISSFLFVIAMDTLSKLLDAAVADGRIQLHSSCMNPVISHLSFADDLLIFFDGSDTSLQAILAVLDDFYRISGLGVNLLKSTLFLDGNDSTALTTMASSYGLSQGILPVKYLGVPLIPHKMKLGDFQPLLERLQSRFSSWTNRYLSFAGRLQLLHSVINSIINFWASVFILPKQCLKKIEQLCNAFLWSGNTLSGRRAKVSWDTVCTPRQSGGLGLRRLANWTSVLSLKLIWMLFSNSGSLWVSWVRANLLHHGNLWEARSSSGSWLWLRLLKLRNLARSFIHCRVGSGSSCSFWHDNWTGLGPLSLFLDRQAISFSGIRHDDTVQEAISRGNWRLPSRSRNPTISFLRSILPDAATVLQPLVPDTFHWRYPDDVPSQQISSQFSASRTYAFLFPAPPEVPWHRPIWFSGRIPKHAFITWLATLGRLATLDRIHRFSPAISTTCLLCSTHDETRDHLFFSCSYSFSLLCIVLQLVPTHSDLLSLLQWLPQSSPHRYLRIIAHLLLQASVYSLWRERNSRLHTNVSRPLEQLVRDIGITVKAKLIALTTSYTHNSPTLLETWFGHQDHDHRFCLSP